MVKFFRARYPPIDSVCEEIIEENYEDHVTFQLYNLQIVPWNYSNHRILLSEQCMCGHWPDPRRVSWLATGASKFSLRPHCATFKVTRCIYLLSPSCSPIICILDTVRQNTRLVAGIAEVPLTRHSSS